MVLWSFWLAYSTFIGEKKLVSKPVPKISLREENRYILKNIYLSNIMNRIAEHKTGLSSLLSTGLARGRHGNPAASLKVHELYGSPKLFSGLASLVLSKPETSAIDHHYQKTIMNLQRLHERTPRSFVFLLAGCLPGEAILHQKQLTIFMMICYLPENPLNAHARQVLMSGKTSSKSWFNRFDPSVSSTDWITL